MTAAQLPPALFRAELETRSFTFEAYGSTPREAKQLLAEAWRVHCEQTGAEPDLITEDLRDLTPYAVRPGQAFRDDALIVDEKDSHAHTR